MGRRRVGLVFGVWTFLFVISMFALSFNIHSTNANTNVGGPITSDTAWTEANSPYIVISSVLVSQGVTLTIEPGVVVKFNLAKGIQVDGQLIARGTKAKPIVFTSIRDDTYSGDTNGDGNLTTPAPGDWAYIFFTNSSIDASFDADGKYVAGSILEYCRITYSGSAGTQGEIYVDSSAPFLNYTIVSNSANNGIYVSYGSPKIVNSIISYNGMRGIQVYEWSDNDVTIVGNTVTNNLGDGIYLWGYSRTKGTIENNTIANNRGTGVVVGGYSYYGWCFFTIKGNIVRSNSGGGIRVSEQSTAITNNVVVHNWMTYGGYGAGISITEGHMVNQSLTNNIIAYNTASHGGALYLDSDSGRNLTVSGNSIVGNTATADSIVHISGDSLDTFKYNLLTQNKDNSAVSNCIKVAGLPTVNYNNLFNNFHSYEIYNTNAAGSSHVDAKNNWWGTSNETEVQAKIYDWFDDATKGIVDYSPYASTIRTDTPISPPTGLAVTAEAGSFILNWNPNPEPDLAGYKIYYDTDSGYPYGNSIDVGNVTSHTLTGLPSDVNYFTVTAYDAEADGINDLFEGHESWYAAEAIRDTVPPATINDYDGSWHNADFTITLNATDDFSGVAETYYKTNDGPTRNVSTHGQPQIPTESSNNTLEYWSVDNAGNEEFPHNFLTGIKLDKTAPTIGVPSRTPDEDILPEQEVKVSVTVADAVSEVKNVTLSYTINDGITWTNLPMNYSPSTSLYEATIPPQRAGTWVKYKIVAQDNAENQAAKDGTDPYCTYQVIPEFPPTTIPPTLIILTILAIAFAKRKFK